jgi:hypothetical protein
VVNSPTPRLPCHFASLQINSFKDTEPLTSASHPSCKKYVSYQLKRFIDLNFKIVTLSYHSNPCNPESTYLKKRAATRKRATGWRSLITARSLLQQQLL